MFGNPNVFPMKNKHFSEKKIFPMKSTLFCLYFEPWDASFRRLREIFPNVFPNVHFTCQNVWNISQWSQISYLNVWIRDKMLHFHGKSVWNFKSFWTLFRTFRNSKTFPNNLLMRCIQFDLLFQWTIFPIYSSKALINEKMITDLKTQQEEWDKSNTYENLEWKFNIIFFIYFMKALWAWYLQSNKILLISFWATRI